MREVIQSVTHSPAPQCSASICAFSLHTFLSSFFFSVILSSLVLSLSLFRQSCGFTPPVDRVVYVLATGELSAGVWHQNTHSVSKHDNAGQAYAEGGFMAEKLWGVKNLHHSSLWITVLLLLTGVCSSCWCSLGLSNLPGFIQKLKWLFWNVEARGRISSIKYVLTGAADSQQALRGDWQQGDVVQDASALWKKSWRTDQPKICELTGFNWCKCCTASVQGGLACCS